MTKTELQTLNKILDRIERQLGVGAEIEDLSETLIQIYGLGFIDEVFYGVISERKSTLSLFRRSLLLHMLTSRNATVRRVICGYFLAAGGQTAEDFLKKYLEFQKVVTAWGTIRDPGEKEERGRMRLAGGHKGIR